MALTIGQFINRSRKRSGLTQQALGDKIGMTKSDISKIENDQLKNGPSNEAIMAISDALCDDGVMIHYIETNPVYLRILPKIFSDLNNIRDEPAIIFSRIQKEANECSESAGILAEIFGNADPTRTPMFEEVFKRNMEQIIDIKRGVEIVEFKLMAANIITKDWLDGVYAQQQQKCIEHGHHDPSKDAAAA